MTDDPMQDVRDALNQLEERRGAMTDEPSLIGIAEVVGTIGRLANVTAAAVLALDQRVTALEAAPRRRGGLLEPHPNEMRW
jgi:hypothetical protein